MKQINKTTQTAQTVQVNQHKFNNWIKNIPNYKSLKYTFNSKLSYEENKNNVKSIIIHNKYYGKCINSIKKVIQGYNKILFIQGRAGCGKSYSIRKILKSENANFKELTGDITEAYLYRLLFENNGKIIWCKDLVKLFKNQATLNILKGACESEKNCLLTKNNYSKFQDDLPDSFNCTCKFIFDFNTINSPNLRVDMDALISRGEFLHLQISNNEIIEIMRNIAKSEIDTMVTEFLIKELNKIPYVDINLRTQYNAIKTYHFSIKNNLDWKNELKFKLKQTSSIVTDIYSIIGKSTITTVELKKNIIKRGIVNSLS